MPMISFREDLFGEWFDHGIEALMNKGENIISMADFGDDPTNGAFCIDGLICPMYTRTVEYKKVIESVETTEVIWIRV